MLGAVPACDTDVQTLLVTGMNDAAVVAASTLVDAAFESIMPDQDDPAPQGDGNDRDSDTDLPQL